MFLLCTNVFLLFTPEQKPVPLFILLLPHKAVVYCVLIKNQVSTFNDLEVLLHFVKM